MSVYQTSAVVEPHQITDSALSVSRIVHRRFPVGTHRIDDEFSVRHFQDLTAPYGVPYRSDLAARGGNTFTTMVAELVAEHGLTAAPVGLGIVAHATPDLDCRLAAPTHLSEVLDADALTFTLSDHGRCAPFTALRLASCYAQRHGYERALVAQLDQATMPYEPDCRHEERPVGDSAVVLLLERTATPARVRHVTDVSSADLPARVERVLAESSVDELTAIITGPGIVPDRDLPGVSGVRPVEPGYPCTGVWAELAECTGPALVLEHDASTGDLGVFRTDAPAETR